MGTGSQPTRIARRYAAYLTVVALAAVIAGRLGFGTSSQTVLHVVALPPLDLFHDLRLLLASAPSQWLFWPGLLVVVLFRAAALAWVLAGSDRAGWLGQLRVTVPFYAVGAAPLLVAAAAAFASGATLFYLMYWIGLLVAAVAFLVLGPVPWTGQWRFWRHGRRSWCSIGYLGLLVAAGVTYEYVPLIALLCAAGLAVGTAYLLVTGRWPVLQFSVGVATSAMAIVLLAVLLASPDQPEYRSPPPESDVAGQGSLLLVGGIDSSTGTGAVYELDPRAIGFACEQTYYFSYAGSGTGVPDAGAACPVRTGARYGGEHTYRSVSELAAELADQVAPLPEPVTVVAHSQGVWVVHRALTSEPRPDVSRVAYVGALSSARVTYPEAIAPGSGAVGRQLLELASAVVNARGLSQYRPDQPLATELLADPAQHAWLLSQPLPDSTQAVVIPSLFDLPMAGRPDVASASVGCPVAALHPALPYSPDVHGQVRALGRDQPATSCAPFGDLILGLRQFGAIPNWSRD